jgi:hypothetical protein
MGNPLDSQRVLYNVSGVQAVELELRSGKRLRIGTDEPTKLCEMIRTMKELPNELRILAARGTKQRKSRKLSRRGKIRGSQAQRPCSEDH